MANEVRLINANEALSRNDTMKNRSDVFRSYAKVVIDGTPTVDAVEVAQIEETKQYILQIFDNLIEIDKPLAYEFNEGDPYYKGKLSAFEISRRLVNAALTDLCENCCTKMDLEE